MFIYALLVHKLLCWCTYYSVGAHTILLVHLRQVHPLSFPLFLLKTNKFANNQRRCSLVCNNLVNFVAYSVFLLIVLYLQIGISFVIDKQLVSKQLVN